MSKTKTIEITMEKWEEIKDQIGEDVKEINELDDFIGQKLFIRAVTYHVIGRVVKRIKNFFELEGASWVADSGRFMNAIKDGTLKEVEPTGKCFVNIDTIVDMYIWNHDLPKNQK